ncbi:hypothetical protein KAJ27_20545 [bacterium]|nr:hypothetical protein [bacterium]
MIKKISISLIIMSTFLYGTVFLMSKRYETSFFDEILFQLNRMAASMNKPEEVKFTKLVLASIVNNEEPPSKWSQFIVHDPKYDSTELFYYYKVWSVKAKLNINDINSSYPIFSASSEKSIILNMRYGKNRPVLQFPFYKNEKGDMTAGLFFPVNERPLSADLNKDNTIDHEDVRIARN